MVTKSMGAQRPAGDETDRQALLQTRLKHAGEVVTGMRDKLSQADRRLAGARKLRADGYGLELFHGYFECNVVLSRESHADLFDAIAKALEEEAEDFLDQIFIGKPKPEKP